MVRMACWNDRRMGRSWDDHGLAARGWECGCARMPCCRQGLPDRALVDEGAGSIGSDTSLVTGLPEFDGVVYGINGVCHQIANRRLYPLRRTAPPAPEYWLSVTLFGTYGTNVPAPAAAGYADIASLVADNAPLDWHARMRTLGSITTRGPADDAGLLTAVAHNCSRARSLPGAAQHAFELDLLLRWRLGNSLSAKSARTVRRTYRQFLSETPGGAPAGPAEHARYVNEAVEGFLDRMVRVLGKARFARLYGFRPGAAIELVRPEVSALAEQTIG